MKLTLSEIIIAITDYGPSDRELDEAIIVLSKYISDSRVLRRVVRHLQEELEYDEGEP